MKVERTSGPLDSTGERFVYGRTETEVELEHVHRYIVAASLSSGKIVLDAACGAGYGSEILAQVATHVEGIDIDAETVAAASLTYQRPNLTFRQSDVSALPHPDASVDVVVSFETLEHVSDQEGMLQEFCRVLRPGGTLIASTPSRNNYNRSLDTPNPFHVTELEEDEFGALLRSHFSHVEIYGQRTVFGSLLTSRSDNSRTIIAMRRLYDASIEVNDLHEQSMYLIAVCSNASTPALQLSCYEGSIPQNALSSLLGGVAERDRMIAQLSQVAKCSSPPANLPTPPRPEAPASPITFAAEENIMPQATLDKTFRSMEEWTGWFDANRNIADDGFLRDALELIRLNGITEPLTERVFEGATLRNMGDNYREGIATPTSFSRLRAVLLVLQRTMHGGYRHGPSIYAPEAITAFALLLRGLFPKFIGSEYTPDLSRPDYLYPIDIQDLTSLTHPSGSFDFIVTNEVLEHVPDLDAGLREMARVLRPGGYHIGTCPFRATSFASEVKTVIRNGELVHLSEPEWHGDPMTEKGSLVFEIPGWDILERAKAAGFSDAGWRLVQSIPHGILAQHFGGVFVLVLQK